MSAIVPPLPRPFQLADAAGTYQFSVKQYHQMIDVGILTPNDRAELLDGYVVNKMPQTPPHASAISRLSARLIRCLPAGWTFRIRLPITLSASEPEPDVAIIRGDEQPYDARHPGPRDFGIVIEVADSSLAFDRHDKGRIYAEANIPIYWIVNVVDRRIEVYSDPRPTATPPAYATRTDYLPGQDVPITLDGQVVASIAVADLLP